MVAKDEGANKQDNTKPAKKGMREDLMARAWKPGQSGNPSGRPKMPVELKEMLKRIAPEMFQVVIDIAKDPKSKPSDRIKASEILIERVYGKAAQPICGDEEGSAIVVKLQGDLESWGK